MKQVWQATFENKDYKKEWKEKTFFTRKLYKIGTVIEEEDGTFAVYDGAHNLMGHFDKKGAISYNKDKNEYKDTFMKNAIEFAKKEKRIK